ncbi:MAG: FMN phosphatase YigB (HAD superfamily) [Paraglaciecola sp.]|jgi:FMN phosphatase YigB (HAD superfamily)
MVGDSFEKDVISALEADLHGIWFNFQGVQHQRNANVRTISALYELISKNH